MLTEQQKIELRTQYNPKGSPVRNLQEELLDIIKLFDLFCRKNGLKYSLADGSLIGAVRHAGFIPWDDDLDIMMHRLEYEKLRALVSEDGTIEGNLKLVNDRAVLKLSTGGLFVDLQVLDNVPDSVLLRMFKKYVCIFLITLIKAKNVLIHKRYRTILKWWFVFFPIVVFIRRETLQRWLQEGGALWEDWNGTGQWICTKKMGKYIDIPSFIGRGVSSEAYAEYIELPFEDTKLMCIKGYDLFLKTIYGDYMSLPKHIQTHGRAK